MPLTDDQLSALRRAVKDRMATDTGLADAYARKDCDAVAAIMSAGRTKHGPTQIGAGTVCAVLGERGGLFLDAVETLGATDRNIYWEFDPVRRGVLDFSVPAAPLSMLALKSKLPDFIDDIDKLLQIGVVPDPYQVGDVHLALYEPDGMEI